MKPAINLMFFPGPIVIARNRHQSTHQPEPDRAADVNDIYREGGNTLFQQPQVPSSHKYTGPDGFRTNLSPENKESINIPIIVLLARLHESGFNL